VKTKHLRNLVLGLAVCLAGHATAQGQLEGLSTRKVGAGVEVAVQGSKLGKPREIRSADGRSLILEFDGTLKGAARKIQVDHAGLASINYAQFSARPPKVRVNFRFDAAAKPRLAQEGGAWKVLHNVPLDLQTLRTNTPVVAPTQSQPFPSQVPPLETFVARTPVAPREAKVSLDFVNTDIVQILKALAMQANVNIITAPEVKGNLTVSLDGTTIQQALDLITTLAGVRYAKVSNTYVVVSGSRFMDAMRTIESGEGIKTTRTVTISSREGKQVKAAVFASMPQSSRRGTYDIILPSDQVEITRTSAEPEGTKGEGGAAKAEASQMVGTTKMNQAREDNYLIIVGSPERLDEVEGMVRAVDRSICEAIGKTYVESNRVIRAIHKVQGGLAVDLVKAIMVGADKADEGLSKEPRPLGTIRLGNVELNASSPFTAGDQVVILNGPEHEVEGILVNLRQLDTFGADEANGNRLHIYEVRSSDPRALRDDIVTVVPGLRVTIAPGPAGNQHIYRPGQSDRHAHARLSGDGDAGKDEKAGQQQTERKEYEVMRGLPGALEAMEKESMPMRLVLRGSEPAIRSALQYLEQVDVAPRQVALEIRVMELSREEAVAAGIDWSIFTGGAVRFIRLQNTQPADEVRNRFDVDITGRNFTANVTATLDRLAANGNLIARPNLLAIDGRASEVFIGDVIRYIESIQATQNGVTVTTGAVRVGIQLSVIPRVGADGNLTMDLRPVVSFLRGFTPVPGGGQLPQTSERMTQQTISILSGETIAIGGLIQEQDRREVAGVPILMDIPILGQLFRRTNVSRQRTELVIFLTAQETAAPGSAATVPLPPTDSQIPYPAGTLRPTGR
jgi:type II secretory pathway component GspD/PulD (secretin)